MSDNSSTPREPGTGQHLIYPEIAEILRQLARPSEEALEELLALVQPTVEAQEMLRRLAQPSEEAQEMLRRLTQPSEEAQEMLRQLAGPSEDTQAALRALLRPSDKLVPEVSLEDDEESQPEPASPDLDVPPAIAELRDLLDEAGRRPVVESRVIDDDVSFMLTFAIPAGRDERVVKVGPDDAAALSEDPQLLEWRSLTVYDGIWNQATSVIEVAVQGERVGPPLRLWLSRVMANGDDETSQYLEVVHPSSGARLTLGEASRTASSILGNRRGAPRGPLTLRCEGARPSTTQAAESLIERLADSLFFDIEVNSGMSMVLGRLESQSRPRRWRPANRRTPSFPISEYPHPPLVLYRLGRDRALAPVIRYWALYQVLEYYFPRYSSEEARRRLSRHLRSPSFDPHREEDVLTAISLVGTTTGAGEREMLTQTLEAITSTDELRRVMAELELVQTLRSGRDLSMELVDERSDDLLRQLAKRVYDVRCRIVHAKSSSPGDLGPGLLAGTEHDDLVQPELPLLEYLAHQALISSAEPFR